MKLNNLLVAAAVISAVFGVAFVVATGQGRSSVLVDSVLPRAGVAQLVERQPSKLNVASSSLVSRSKTHSADRVRPENSRPSG